MELIVGSLKLKPPEVKLKFPATLIAPVAVFVPLPLIVRLLKLLAPTVLATSPFKLIVDPVALKVPSFVQFPFTMWVNAPAVNVVPVPMVTLPFIVKPATAVVVAVPLNVKFPPIVVVVACNVFAPLPERLKL